MVSAEPHIYLTVPSARIWAKNNRAAAVALVLAVIVLVLLVLGLILF
ncbi:hypothetical protein [[Mycobacterium] fortunisiensis]|nr:hypothetical protein [[Mycobacterium] fortunisiensis]